MIFDFFLAVAAELIAVIFSAAFLVWIEGRDCGCKRSSKAIGYFVLILAIATLICTLYHGYRYSDAGGFRVPPKRPNIDMRMDGMNFGPAQLPNVRWKDMPAPPTPPVPQPRMPETEIPPAPEVVTPSQP